MLTLALATVAIGYALVGLAAAALALQCRRRRPEPLRGTPGRLLVVAPHPDDCVIAAGGQAIEVLRRGGRVRIVYVTTGARRHEPELARLREQEARRAWAVLGDPGPELVFLAHEGHCGLVDPDEICETIAELSDAIAQFQPDRVVAPLFEGGHYQHDVANLVTVRALEATGSRAELFEAPEYNFYFSWRTTPHKCLALLSQVVPFWSHPFPPEPIEDVPVLEQPMSAGDVALKQTLLRCFETQAPEALVASAGGPDRVVRHTGHDYTRPPFRYAGSLAWWVDGLKRLPGVGPALARRFRRTRTIHCDPEVRITQLPVRAVDAQLAESGLAAGPPARPAARTPEVAG